MDYPIIGTIVLFAGGYAPEGWAFCEGQELPIQGNEALFSILGYKYGGDERSRFALPNLPKVPDTDGRGESKYMIALQGLYPIRP